MGDLAGSIGRVPPHSHGREVSGLSVLQGREQAVHVSGPSLRASHGPLGVHRGSEPDQDLVVVKNESAVPASDPRTGKVVLPSRSAASQSQEIRTDPEAKVSVSRGNSGPHVSHCFRDGRSKDQDLQSDLPSHSSSGPTIPSSRISVGTTHRDLPDGSSGATSSEMASNRGNQSHPQGPPITVVGPIRRQVVRSLQ